MDPLVGTLIGGKYRLEVRLGEGGMGAVYAAVQEGLNRRCAVKVLHSSLSQDSQLVARFKQEAEVAASMGHPNIVQVTDFGYEDGRVFLVMDLLTGQALAAAIEQGKMSADRVRFIAIQVLSALGAAHDRQIVHRDLKPDNIFLTSLSGVRDVVKLLDFGIARMTGEQSQKMTTTGQVLGTPAYMSPEQARGKKVDPRTDLYSLGVVMYEALSGRMPVTGENYHELMFNIVGETPMPLKELRPDLSQGLLDVVAKAMEKEVADRYQTAKEMHDALEALGPIAVSAPPPVRVTSDPPLEGPETVPDAFANTVTPEAVAAIQTPEPVTTPGSKSTSPTSPRSSPATSTQPSDSTLAPVASEEQRGRMLALGAVSMTLMVVGGGVWAYTRAPDPEPVAIHTETNDAEREATAETLRALNETRREMDEAARNAMQAPEAMTSQMSETVETISMHQGRSTTVASMTSMSSMSSMSSMARHAEMRAEVESGDGSRPRSPSTSMFASEPPPPDYRRSLGPYPWHDASGIPIVWQRCGNNVVEVYPVLANTRLSAGVSSNPHVVANEHIRPALRQWSTEITECFRNHTLRRGQPFEMTFDASGTVTHLATPSRMCPPPPPPVIRCMEQLINGKQLPPDTGAPGVIRFSVGVRGA